MLILLFNMAMFYCVIYDEYSYFVNGLNYDLNSDAEQFGSI